MSMAAAAVAWVAAAEGRRQFHSGGWAQVAAGTRIAVARILQIQHQCAELGAAALVAVRTGFRCSVAVAVGGRLRRMGLLGRIPSPGAAARNLSVAAETRLAAAEILSAAGRTLAAAVAGSPAVGSQVAGTARGTAEPLAVGSAQWIRRSRSNQGVGASSVPGAWFGLA